MIVGRTLWKPGLLKNFFTENRLFAINLIKRDANCEAHTFARNSRYFENSHIWVESPNFVDGLFESVCTICI